MYHIEQLRSKEIAELQSIATDLGITGIKSLDRDSLIYRILDGQALQNSQSGAPAVVKEETRMHRREHRRNRIQPDASNKVYTATGEKAVKLDKNEPKKTKEEPVAIAPVEVPAEAPVVQETVPTVTAEPAAPAPKKRGRKPKNEPVVAETAEIAATEQPAAEVAVAAPDASATAPAPKNVAASPRTSLWLPKPRRLQQRNNPQPRWPWRLWKAPMQVKHLWL